MARAPIKTCLVIRAVIDSEHRNMKSWNGSSGAVRCGVLLIIEEHPLIHGLATCPTAVILVDDGTQLYTPVSCLHLFQKKANCTRSRAFEGKSLGGKSFGGKH